LKTGEPTVSDGTLVIFKTPLTPSFVSACQRMKQSSFKPVSMIKSKRMRRAGQVAYMEHKCKQNFGWKTQMEKTIWDT